MFYVYFLINNNKDIYIGYSSNLKKRLKDHNSGRVEYTKNKRPWKLIYYEAFLSKKDAKNREQKLKHHGSSMGHLKNRIEHSLNQKS